MYIHRHGNRQQSYIYIYIYVYCNNIVVRRRGNIFTSSRVYHRPLLCSVPLCAHDAHTRGHTAGWTYCMVKNKFVMPPMKIFHSRARGYITERERERESEHYNNNMYPLHAVQQHRRPGRSYTHPFVSYLRAFQYISYFACFRPSSCNGA